MRVARWRWVLVPMVVVVAGCLPQPTTNLPASFTEAFNGAGNPTFTVQPPPAGAGQEVVAALRVQDPMSRSGRAIPIFGVMDCHGKPGCQPGPGGTDGGPARAVWVVLYPDCTNGDDIGWVLIDAVNGVGHGSILNEVCHP